MVHIESSVARSVVYRCLNPECHFSFSTIFYLHRLVINKASCETDAAWWALSCRTTCVDFSTGVPSYSVRSLFTLNFALDFTCSNAYNVSFRMKWFIYSNFLVWILCVSFKSLLILRSTTTACYSIGSRYMQHSLVSKSTFQRILYV